MAALESEHGDKELDEMETNTSDISKELEQQKTVLTLESILMISILDILASCFKVLWYFELCSRVCPTNSHVPHTWMNLYLVDTPWENAMDVP